MEQLPVLHAPRERADASRNRARVLEAAAALFDARGADEVTMDEVAAAAGVGKGTLYRRFGDKAGLGVALLDVRERDLQDQILRGSPPLGPGASSRDRLHAFIDAYLAYLARNLDLVVMCETAAPGARYRSDVYAGWHLHVGSLLRDAGSESSVVEAHLLLGLLDADLLRVVSEGGAGPTDEVRAAIHRLADALVGGDGAGDGRIGRVSPRA